MGEALNNFADQNARLLVLERQAVERLEKLDRAKSDFVSNVSHELRTPLTSIARLRRALRGRLPRAAHAAADGHARGGDRNVHRLQALIEDLLTLSQVESQAFRSTFDVLDLNHLATEAAHDLRADRPGPRCHAALEVVPSTRW